MVAARLAGHTAAEVARLFGVCKRSVERFLSQQRQGGSVCAKQVGGYRRSRLEGHQKQLKRWIARNNDMTLAELRERIRERLQIEISTTALWHRLEALDLNFKKNTASGRTRSPGRPRRPRAMEA
jgi:transposase